MRATRTMTGMGLGFVEGWRGRSAGRAPPQDLYINGLKIGGVDNNVQYLLRMAMQQIYNTRGELSPGIQSQPTPEECYTPSEQKPKKHSTVWYITKSSPHNEVLPPANPLPEPPQSPHPAHPAALLPPPLRLLPLAHLAAPLTLDPAPEPVLDTLPLNGLLPLDNGRRDMYGRHARHAFLGQHGALDEGLGRGTSCKTASQADGDEGAA